MPEAVTKASAPTVTGCLSAEARIKAKIKLFQQKMNDNSPAAAIPGPASGTAIGVLDVGAHILKIAAHDPQDQRQRDQLIDPDDAEIGVVETELLIVERQRQQHEQR